MSKLVLKPDMLPLGRMLAKGYLFDETDLDIRSHKPTIQCSERNNMKKLLERAIVSSIVKEKKTIGSISNYGILRYASGIFMVRVYWKGQTKKGDKRCITVEMDTEPQSAILAIEIMESLMEEAKKVTLAEKMKAMGFIDEDKLEIKDDDYRKKIISQHKLKAEEQKNKATIAAVDRASESGW